MKDKPQVGQTLYSLNVGNAARNTEQVLTPVEVTKVGRKYFSCKKEGFSRETQFRIDNWRENSEYSANQFLYETEQEWLNEKERTDLIKGIRDVFDWSKNIDLTLDQLREIDEIVSR